MDKHEHELRRRISDIERRAEKAERDEAQAIFEERWKRQLILKYRIAQEERDELRAEVARLKAKIEDNNIEAADTLAAMMSLGKTLRLKVDPGEYTAQGFAELVVANFDALRAEVGRLRLAICPDGSITDVAELEDHAKELNTIYDGVCEKANELSGYRKAGELVEEVSRLRSALEFYADEKTYLIDDSTGAIPALVEQGATARAALEGKPIDNDA